MLINDVIWTRHVLNTRKYEMLTCYVLIIDIEVEDKLEKEVSYYEL